MFKRRKLIIFAAVLAAIVCVALFLQPGDAAKNAAAAARRELRDQGFKTDLSDFNFTTSPEMRRREAVLTNAALIAQPFNIKLNAMPRYLDATQIPEFMPIVGNDAAEVIALQQIIDTDTKEVLWDKLRDILAPFDPGLDAACETLCEGTIAFNLNAQSGQHMLLPHLAALKRLQQHLATRTALCLYNEKRDAAWTNLLASTRIVTAWEPEPVEISHLVRWSCAQIAFNITWQALHSTRWSDAQLAQLENEWKSVDFLKAIPDTVAFTRASWVAFCIQQREQPSLTGVPLSETIRSPKNAFYEFQRRAAESRYRNYGSYEDERDLLFFYRDRESDLRRAIRALSWAEMRQMPNVTNTAPFQSKHKASTLSMMMNMKQITGAMMSRGAGVFGRAAEAESRRRLLLVAIALERHKLRAGSYPKTVAELSPPPTLTDFMDGQPLRYRLSTDGQFVLYSVGLDCVDNGGVAANDSRSAYARGRAVPGVGLQNGKDLVWPRAATEQEIKAQEQRELEQEKLRPAFRSRGPGVTE